MEWQTFFYCSCRREDRVRAPFCSGVLEYSLIGSVDEGAKIIKQVVMSFPEGFRLSSYYRSASAALAECRMAMGCRGRQLQC